jgi:NAD(P)-dependent dehydrogenase (short-subunit alcohol dehydrogenase family)
MKQTKTAVITGATSGIGLAVVKKLLSEGYRVIGTGRNHERCSALQQVFQKEFGENSVTYLCHDLASLEELRKLALDITLTLERAGETALDILINNAGIVTDWYIATEDGYETQFAVNHLAPFYLTHLLTPLLMAAESPRVLTTSSGSHYKTVINWKDPMMRRHYGALKAYKQSKLCNVLFTHELTRKSPSKLLAFAIDPGLVNTDIGEKGTSGIVNWFWKIRRKGGTAPEVPAETYYFLSAAS